MIKKGKEMGWLDVQVGFVVSGVVLNKEFWHGSQGVSHLRWARNGKGRRGGYGKGLPSASISSFASRLIPLGAVESVTGVGSWTWRTMIPVIPKEVKGKWKQFWKQYAALSTANPESVMSRNELIFLALCIVLDRPVIQALHWVLTRLALSWNAMVDRLEVGIQNLKERAEPASSSSAFLSPLPRAHVPRAYEESTLHALEGMLRLLAILYFCVTGLSAFAIFLRAWKITLPKDITKRIENIGLIVYATFVARKIVIYLVAQTVRNLRWMKSSAKIFSLERFFEIVIYALGFFGIITWIGVPLPSVLAFGGVGGIALGLATKEIAQNLVGGVMLSFVAPFGPGDYIVTGDGAIEGVVEDVGWYMTRMRGLDFRPTYIPNAIFLDKKVTNISKITHRRFLQTFGVRFNDYGKLRGIIDELRTTLPRLPSVDVVRGFRVFFRRFWSLLPQRRGSDCVSTAGLHNLSRTTSPSPPRDRACSVFQRSRVCLSHNFSRD
mmetsp:Transcript_18290/g.38205  ORF Transcript_18290/g.38205 Transcript_18290/m.38205 type:complete len:494 (-) Transcript_18290:1206-2687(-)